MLTVLFSWNRSVLPVVHVGDRDSKQKLSPSSESDKIKISLLILMFPIVIALIGHPLQ